MPHVELYRNTIVLIHLSHNLSKYNLQIVKGSLNNKSAPSTSY